MSNLTMGELFSGQCGFSVAGELSGIKTKFMSEVEIAPIMVEGARFPEAKQLGDVSKVNGAEIEPVDIITFGSPCFAAGSLVTTDRGLVPIEEVKIGDRVLTHKNRFRVVTASTQTGTRETLVLKAMGVDAIEATPNHKFLVRRMQRKKIKRDGKWREVRVWSEAEWVELSEIDEKCWVGIASNPNKANPHNLTEEECWLIGRYIADGSLYNKRRYRKERNRYEQSYRVIFSVGKAKVDEFESNVIEHRYSKVENRTEYNFTVHDKRLHDLCLLCGKGAANKQFPAFVIDLPVRLLDCVINGYMSGDGCIHNGVRQANTVSKKLAYTLGQCISKCYGRPYQISKCSVRSNQFIEGRALNNLKPQYIIRWNPSQAPLQHAFFENGYAWNPVRSIKEGAVQPVYDLTVEDDHSFCVQNVIVHNCQDLSVAGKRKGMRHSLNGDEDSTRSGLFFDAVRVIEEMRDTAQKKPRYACWENVSGAMSSAKGEDFRRVLEELCQIKDINAEVPLIKWPSNGEIVGKDYSLAWRVVNAMHWGVPQRRRRIYLLADFDGHTAGKIMFRNEGLEFHARVKKWTEFGRDSEPLTGEEFVRLFNEQLYEVEEREINEPSGKFARLDIQTGLWSTEVPDGYFIGEKPYYQNPTKLSEILQPNADPKYYLSPKAAQGILRRARERGKELPEVLRIALERQAKENPNAF